MRLKLVALGVIALIALAVLTVSVRRSPPIVRFGCQTVVGDALCIVAVEKDLFKEEGLAVRASRFTSGPACAEALYSGSVDVATMGDTTAVIALSRGDRHQIIASHGRGEHRHRIMVPASSALKAPTDLAGTRLAVKKGTSTHGGLLLFFDKHGLDPKSLTLIDMRPEDMPEALLAGSIDAMVASEPIPSIAEVKGARELATLGGLGNCYPLLIVARRDWLAKKPGEAKRFLEALRKAEQFVENSPKETAAILSRISRLPQDSAERAMSRHTYRLAIDQSIRESLARTAQFLHSQKTVYSVPDIQKALDTSWMPAK